MIEEERRLEILKAEAAIRELAGRMAEAIECTGNAEMAKATLEAALRSMDELNIECRALIESQKTAFEEEFKSLNQARESLDISAKDLQKAHERLEEKTENFEFSLEEKNQEFYKLIDAKLDNLLLDINTSQAEIVNKFDHLEMLVNKQKQEIREPIVTKLGNLSQEIIAISNKLLFVMDQNEALVKRILALQRISEEQSRKFQEVGNDVSYNSGEIQGLGTQVLDCNERISSLEQAFESKTSGLSHRLRSAIIGGGLGVVMILMIIKLV